MFVRCRWCARLLLDCCLSAVSFMWTIGRKYDVFARVTSDVWFVRGWADTSAHAIHCGRLVCLHDYSSATWMLWVHLPTPSNTLIPSFQSHLELRGTLVLMAMAKGELDGSEAITSMQVVHASSLYPSFKDYAELSDLERHAVRTQEPLHFISVVSETKVWNLLSYHIYISSCCC